MFFCLKLSPVFGLKEINTWPGLPCMLGDTEKFIERRDEGNDTRHTTQFNSIQRLDIFHPYFK